MRKIIVLAAILALFSCTYGIDSRKLDRIDDVVLEAIDNGKIPGAVVSIVRGNRIVYLKAWGNRSVVPDTAAMTTGTVFDLASVTKCVSTTLSFMQLVESGRVRLGDKVNQYIPGFRPWTDPDTGETVDIRIRDLMTHSSGLSAYVDVNKVASLYGEPCPSGLMEYISNEVTRHFRPGTDFLYSCLNFVTLQNILEKVTGERLCDYAYENVFRPLGLEHTRYYPLEDPGTAALVAPTTVQEDGLPLLGIVHDPLARRLNRGNSGNAGCFSNAEDLSVIASAILGGGEYRGRRILGKETVRAMATVPSCNAPEVGRALGWDVSSSHSWFIGDIATPGRTLNHTGYTGTSMAIDLDSDMAVIILTNRCHPRDEGSVGDLRARIHNIAFGSIIK